MIELKNINHKYKSKKGSEVLALKDINFTFSDSGIYFLTGKSGCGKSTLLNILSGIDNLQDGEILIDDHSMSKFSIKDYDNYRNNYAGIIFQEFNLIESMTVFENIDMPLKLQGKTDNKEIIADCLKKVDLEGYENRFPSELSGGQRQRITIARQLAKGSKIILADEPTGSLDSENSKNIFELLRELSKETLIVVASHDLEFAEIYGDEIVTLVDGQIVNLQTKSKLDKSKKSQNLKQSKNKFPNAYALKFALKDIFNTKVRFFIAALLCIVSLAMFGMFVTVTSFSSQTSIAHTLVNKQERFVSTGVANYDESGIVNTVVNYSKPFSQKQINHINANYVSNNYIKQTIVNGRFHVSSTKKMDRLAIGNDAVAVIESPDDIGFYGYSLANGYLPLTNDNVYITDYYAYVIIYAEYGYFADNVFVSIPDNASVYSLIGKTISKNANSDKKITVAGIINTDYTRFMTRLNEYDMEKDYEFAEYSYLCNTVYTTFFATQEYLNAQRDRINLQSSGQNYYKLKIDDKDVFVGGIYNNMQNVANMPEENVVLFKDSYSKDMESLKLNKNQVIVTIDVYNAIFNDNRTQDYYCEFSDGINILKYPSHIGGKIKIELFDAIDSIEIIDLEEVEIVGLYCNRSFSYTQSSPNIYMGDEDYSIILQNTIQYHKIDVAVKNDSKYMTNILNDLRDQYILADNYFTQSIYDFEYSFSFFKDMFMIFGLILLVFSIIIFANFISVAILNRKKDIGIIRAIGGSRKNVLKIFFMEGLLFVMIVSILALAISFLLTIIMESVLVKSMISGCVLLVFNPLNILIIPLACFAVMLITTYYPIRKISKRSPVDIIRNN